MCQTNSIKMRLVHTEQMKKQNGLRQSQIWKAIMQKTFGSRLHFLWVEVEHETWTLTAIN